MLIILLLGALAALGPLSIDMYLPAFPAIGAELGVDSQRLSVTVASFFVGLCLGQLVYGPLSDRLGRKRPLLLGIAIYGAASLGCMLCQSLEMLTWLRFLQAFGACSGVVIGRALIRDLFAPHETSRIFSMVMVTMGVSPILAPVAGQLMADFTGWRGIFGIMTGFAGLVWLAVLVGLPEVRPAAVSGLSLPRRAASILSNRTFLAYTLSGTIVQGGLYAYVSGSAALFMTGLGLSPKAFSLLFGLNAAGLIFSSHWNTRLLQRYSYRQILARSLQVAAVAGLVLAGMGKTLLVVGPLFVFIACLGMVFPNSVAGALAEQGHQAGTASALLGSLQYGGAALASAAVGALGAYSQTPMQLTMCICGLLSLAVFGWLVPRQETFHRPTN
jgi:DHA1 family bicyclomycin/chloramphenicol resistance-like MFS transporter